MDNLDQALQHGKNALSIFASPAHAALYGVLCIVLALAMQRQDDPLSRIVGAAIGVIGFIVLAATVLLT